MSIKMIEVDDWGRTAEDIYYICGFIRSVPGVKSFVFPVLRNTGMPDRTFLSAAGESAPELVEIDDLRDVSPVYPVRLCVTTQLTEFLPIYGFEHDTQRCCFGSATAILRFFSSPSNHVSGASLAALQRLFGYVHSAAYKSQRESFFAVSTSASFFIEPRDAYRETAIKVVGIGDAGRNLVEQLADAGVDVDLIAANTDHMAAPHRGVHHLRLGNTPMTAANSPERGREAALQSLHEVQTMLAGAHLVFVIAGIGGGTGSGAAPVVARIARDLGILTVGIVTTPFSWESASRHDRIDAGIAAMQESVHSLIVVSQREISDRTKQGSTQFTAIAQANRAITGAIRAIHSILNVPGHVNVDFEDVQTVLREPGRALIGTGTAAGSDRARLAAEMAVGAQAGSASAMASAKGVLVLITADKGSLKLSESKIAMNTIRAYASPDAHVIYGTCYEEGLSEFVRVTVIASGLQPRSSTSGSYSSALGELGPIESDRAAISSSTTRQVANVFPSVWRTNRSIVRIVEPEEEEDFELPAFLMLPRERRQK